MSFLNSQGFLGDVDDEHRGRGAVHVADTAQLLVELVLLALEQEELLLGQAGAVHVGEVHFLKFLEAVDALGDGLEVGQHAAEPTLGDVGHVHAGGLVGDSFLSLLLGADEEHGAVVGHGGLDEVVRLVDHVERLEQVDDVDAVALGEDELLHLRVPTTGLVAEVQASLQHIAHSDLSHGITTFHCRFLPGHAHLRAAAPPVSRVAQPTDTSRREHDANLLCAG